MCYSPQETLNASISEAGQETKIHFQLFVQTLDREGNISILHEQRKHPNTLIICHK